MTGVEVIVAALAAGAGAGTSDVAKAGVVDLYTGLRDALRRRLAGRPHAEQALEVDESDPAVWQARLGDSLAVVGADHDERILATARQLLELVDPAAAKAGRYFVNVREAKGVQVGDHNIQHNTFV